MNYRKWLYNGTIIFVISILVGILGTIWGIYSSFDALKTSEGAKGIDDVGTGIENAVFAGAFSLIGGLIGLILITIGGVKAYRLRKSQN